MKLVVNDIGGNDDGVILYRGLDDPRDEFAGESLHEGIEREVEQHCYSILLPILLGRAYHQRREIAEEVEHVFLDCFSNAIRDNKKQVSNVLILKNNNMRVYTTICT